MATDRGKTGSFTGRKDDKHYCPSAEVASLSPGELVLARSRAFGCGDFGFVYDSYHPDSNFRHLFPDRQAYLQYGENVLGGEFRIFECRVLREDAVEETARVMFYLDTLYRGERRESIEVGHFACRAGRWLYMMGEKGDRKAFPSDLAGIEWEDFERLKEPLSF